MFYEARSDGWLGFGDVGYNTLKRLSMGYRGAKDVCDVVYSPKQYSWTHEPTQRVSRGDWSYKMRAYDMAYAMLTLYLTDQLPQRQVGTCEDGSTHYHRWDVSPDWADPMTGSMVEVCGRSGAHIHYIGY